MIFKTQSKFIPRDFTLFDAAVSGLLFRFCRPAVTGVGHRRQGRAGARLHPSAMTRSRTAAAGEDVTGGADAAVTLDPGPGPKQTGAGGGGARGRAGRGPQAGSPHARVRSTAAFAPSLARPSSAAFWMPSWYFSRAPFRFRKIS